MRRFALILLLLAGPLRAEDWVPLSGAEISAALTDRALEYVSGDAWQDFRASGRTLYIYKGRESWGYGRVENDRYCSQWPPSDLWACYRLESRAGAVRFVGEAADDISVATYAE